jgi:two-component system NtrC family sensor kinase
MRLSSKFILSVTTLIIFIISLVILTTLHREQAMILGRIQRKGFVLAEVLAMTSVNAVLNFDYSTLKRYLDTVTKDKDVIYVMMLDKEGVVKMHTNLDRLGSRITDPFFQKALYDTEPIIQKVTDHGQRNIYEIGAPIIAGDQTLGVIRIAMSSENIQIEIRRSRNWLLLIGLIAIGIGIIGAIFMAEMIARPIKKLVIGAQAVSQGNLDWNVEIKAKDEIGILADAFSYMSRNLRNYIESLVRTEKLAILGQLASVIAHEVRNPMEPIKGSAEILQKKYPEHEDIQKYAQIIKDEIHGLCGFVDEFLDFAKPQTPQFTLVNLNEVLQEIFNLSEHYLSDHQMAVEWNCCDKLPDIYADSSQLKQVFINVILNAVQAKKNGEGCLKITTRFLKNSAHNEWIGIEFLDYGYGIPKEKINQVFEPFFTTKDEGSGLGLAICQRIVERHQGTITIESETGQWTLVRISFPVIDNHEITTG